eukprot:scaffold8.g1592.t1
MDWNSLSEGAADDEFTSEEQLYVRFQAAPPRPSTAPRSSQLPTARQLSRNRAAKRAVADLTAAQHRQNLFHMNRRVTEMWARAGLLPTKPQRSVGMVEDSGRDMTLTPRSCDPPACPLPCAAPCACPPAQPARYIERPATRFLERRIKCSRSAMRAAILAEVVERRIYEGDRLRALLRSYLSLNSGEPFFATLCEVVAELQQELGLPDRAAVSWAMAELALPSSGSGGSAGQQQACREACEAEQRPVQEQQVASSACASGDVATAPSSDGRCSQLDDAAAAAAGPPPPELGEPNLGPQPEAGEEGLLPPPAVTVAAATAAAEQPGAPDPKRQICFDFTKNQCSRGNACKFSHNVDLIIRVNSQEKGICFDFLKGLCTRGLLCRFSHDLRNLQAQQMTSMSAKKRFAPICYDFVKNQCTRGEDCKYSHDYSSILYGPRAPGKDPYVICVDFTRGKCSRGASCRYSHVDPRLLAASPVDPTLLAAGLGAALVATSGAMDPASGQAAGLQAQAALLLTGLAPLPAAPDSIGAWPGSLQQGPDAYAALLEQMQHASLVDVLSPTLPGGPANSGTAAALSALLNSGTGVSPAFGPSMQDTATLPSLVNILQAASAPQGAGHYSQVPAASSMAADALSAGPTPTAAAAAVPTPFCDALSVPPPGPIATKPKDAVMPVFHGLVAKAGNAETPLGGARDTDSPTIGASWGQHVGGQEQLHDGVLRQTMLASQLQQQQQQQLAAKQTGVAPGDPPASQLPSGYDLLSAMSVNNYGSLRSIWSGGQ